MVALKRFAALLLIFSMELPLASADVRIVSGPSDEYPFLNEIIIRTDQTNGNWPDPLTLITSINMGDPITRARLGGPTRARYLVENRILPKFLANLPRDDPRARLHEMIVLTFSDADHSTVAEQLLRNDLTVLSVERARGAHFASAPNDPLLINSYVDNDVTRYQWGAERLNLVAAWEKARGYGYLAILDNGIQVHGFSSVTHEDLQTNFKQQFSHNFDTSNGVTNPGQHGGGSNSSDNVDEEPFTLYDNNNNVIQANIAGHGTHTAGILAAQANNSLGVAGTCQSCSLMVGRITTFSAGSPFPSMVAIASGLTWMTQTGAQVINNSFGGDPALNFDCTHYASVCTALQVAADSDVVVVAAAGNRRSTVDFFANQSGVIAAAGAQYDASGAAFWNGTTQNNTPFGSNHGTEIAIAAPAANVISSVYTGTDWNFGSPDSRFVCGDNFPSGYYTGYGICSGTSMSAPFVAGVAALARSVFPTATRTQIRSFITGTAQHCANDTNNYCGSGFADASAVVTAALGGGIIVNRLTPLFSLYSADRYDHLYTVVPQMSAAAILGTLLPLSYTGNQFGYASIGPLVPTYSIFPGIPCNFSPCDTLYPRAMVSVFTTFRNPFLSGPELVPLYRYSYACPSSVPSYCSNHQHVSHAYATNASEAWINQRGYKLDGIEGYVFPTSASRPPGTVKLCRRYYPSNDDYILFPGVGTNGSDCSAYTDGYTPGGNNYTDQVVNTDWIGWVYSARAPQPVYSPAFLEILIGVDD